MAIVVGVNHENKGIRKCRRVIQGKDGRAFFRQVVLVYQIDFSENHRLKYSRQIFE